MSENIKDNEVAFRKLRRALLTDSEEEWDRIVNDESEIGNNQDSINRIYIKVCGKLIIDKQSETSNAIEFLVTTYDNDNIRITIDASRNHGRAHIHIGIRRDNYHSASIAIDNGTVLNNTGNIADWKVRKLTDWVRDNRQILEKIYRSINPWEDTTSAEKRKTRLPDID